MNDFDLIAMKHPDEPGAFDNDEGMPHPAIIGTGVPEEED